jgi:hypothetical protein
MAGLNVLLQQLPSEYTVADLACDVFDFMKQVDPVCVKLSTLVALCSFVARADCWHYYQATLHGSGYRAGWRSRDGGWHG